MKRIGFYCLLLLSLVAGNLHAQDNAGNEFVFAMPRNYTGFVELTVFITSEENASSVEICHSDRSSASPSGS